MSNPTGRTICFLPLLSVLYTFALLWIVIPSDLSGLAVGFTFLFILFLSLNKNTIRVWSLIFATLLLANLSSWIREYENTLKHAEVWGVAALFQADAYEIANYYYYHLSGFTSCLSVLLSLGVAFFGFYGRTNTLFIKSRVFYLGLCFLTLMGFAAAIPGLTKRAKRIKETVSAFASEKLAQEKMRMLQPKIPMVKSTEFNSEFEGTLLVLIGESLSKHHMSLYGYPRKTTPRLDSRKDRLEIHSDAVASHSHTVPVLTQMLTGTNLQFSEKPVDNYHQNLLLQLRKSGFEVHWISNQNEYGLWSNPVSLLAKMANFSEFVRVGTDFKNFYSGYSDGSLLSPFKKSMKSKSKKKAIFVHFYAPHAPYCRGIPSDWPRKFTTEYGEKYFGDAKNRSKNLNCYDNAITYVDSQLDRMFEIVESNTSPVVGVFFSDHGEDVVGGTGHHAGKHSYRHSNIPLFWFYNDKGRDATSHKFDILQHRLDRPYSNADLSHSLLDLVGLDGNHFNSARSLFHPDFASVPRRLMYPSLLYPKSRYLAYDEITYQDDKDTWEISRLNLHSLKADRKDIWVHRVNSIGKLLEVQTLFDGVELDIVFDASQSKFFVYHPPKPNIGLSLEEYLSFVNPGLKLWLDWKNASVETQKAAHERLVRLNEMFAIRSRSILETGSAVRFDSSIFSDGGWLHSYYIPTGAAIECATRTERERCIRLTKKILDQVTQMKISNLSFDVRALEYIQSQPDFKKYTWRAWDPRLQSSDYELLSKVEKYFPDSHPLETLLIGFRSQFSN